MGRTTSSDALAGQGLAVRTAVAAVLAVGVNAALTAAAITAGIAPGFRAISFPPVAVLSAAGAIGAGFVYWIPTRTVDRPDRVFRRVAVVVLVVFFIPDLVLLSVDPAATPAGVIVLMIMHVVVAAVSIGAVLAGRGGISG